MVGTAHQSADFLDIEQDGHVATLAGGPPRLRLQERLLEIKTTCGHERTAFWLTRREVDVAAEKSGVYLIRRVFHFRNRAQTTEHNRL
jgi:Domain of unknown function (DUF3883)